MTSTDLVDGVVAASVRPAGSRALADGPACTGADAELFLPVGDRRAQIDDAKSGCARPPVSTICLQQALTERHEHGIWGGHTARERRRILCWRGHRQPEVVRPAAQ